MLRKFHKSFTHLPSTTKSMAYIMWLYFFGQVVANVFIGIYILVFLFSYSKIYLLSLFILPTFHLYLYFAFRLLFQLVKYK